jgi:hypothetical protein
MNKKKIGLVLKEFREGKLKSSAGRKVTKKKQALAIALSEARQDKFSQAAYNLLEFARTRGSRDKKPRRRRKVRESHQELHNVAASNAKTFGATGAGLSLVDKQVRETALKAPSQLGGAIKGALSRAPRYAVKDAVTAAGIGVGLEGLRRVRNKIRDLKNNKR